MRGFICIILNILFTCHITNPIIAQQDTTEHYIQPLQDVFMTELVYPQEKNEFQFTLAPNFQKFNNDKHIQIPIKAEYGITNSWQLEFEWNSYKNLFIHSKLSTNGIGDLQIGTKYSFMNIGNSNFHTAIGFELGIPLGDENKGLGEGSFEYEPYIIMALDFPHLNHAQLFAQVGISFIQQENTNEATEHEEPESDELNLNFGFFIPLKQIIITSEFNWSTNKWSGGDKNKIYFTPGIVWNLSNNWEIGLGLPIGLNNQSDKYRIIAMITFEFNVSGDTD